MEVSGNLSPEMQVRMLHSLLKTPAQVDLFYSLSNDLQRKVATDTWTSEEITDVKCKSRYLCWFSFSLWGFFHAPGSLEEYEHFRLHGMCSRCKEKTERRKARREERLQGSALLEWAWMNDDEQGVEEYWRWHRIGSDYDDGSDAPDTWDLP